MTKPFKSHTAHIGIRACKRLTALLLILLLFVMTIPSVIAETPTSGMLRFDDILELKLWLATAEGQERYKTIYYDDESGQNCKDNIDRLIKATRDNGILVPYVNDQSSAYNCDIYIPDGKDWSCSVFCDIEINNKEYRIIFHNILDDEKQYANNGYVAYKAAVKGDAYNGGEYNGYTPIAFTIGQTEYNGAFKKDDSYDTIYFYAIIDGWDVKIRGNQGVTQEEILNDFTELEFKTEAVPNVMLILIVAAVVVCAVAVIVVSVIIRSKGKRSNR